VLLQPPSSHVLCFAPEPYTIVHLHSAPPTWPSCPRVSSRLPRAAGLARLYALVHCTGSHPCPSRSAIVPLSLSATHPAVPPHMLSSPVPARILPTCRGDLSPCARQFPTFGRIRPSPEPIRVPLPSRRACRAIRLHVAPSASTACVTTLPCVPRVRSCAAPKPPGRPAPMRGTS
jgi:hypothetical protein